MKKSGFEDMENSVVYARDEKIGQIVDFTFDDDFKLLEFIIKADTNKELKARVQVDRDEYFFILPHEMIIEDVKKKIKINAKSTDLNIIYDLDAVKSRLFTKYNHSPVVDESNAYVGHIIDVVFHKDNYFSFILGGSYFREFLNKIGLSNELNLILPVKDIQGIIDNKVVIKKQKYELEKTLAGMKLATGDDALKYARTIDSNEAKMSLDQIYKYTSYR